MNNINEVSKKLLRRYMDTVSAQAGIEKDDPRKRSYKKSEKNAAGFERAFNKSSKYGKMGSRPVKVLATEQNEEQEMNESSHNKKSPAEKLNARLNKLDPKRAARVKAIQDIAAKYRAKPAVKEEAEQIDEIIGTTIAAGLAGAALGLAGAHHAIKKTPPEGKHATAKNYLKNYAKGLAGAGLLDMLKKKKKKPAVKEEVEQTNEAAYGTEKAYAKGIKIRMARRARQREVLNKHNRHMHKTSEGQF